MLSIGSQFAGYRIEGLLGEGGMGAVYLARHPRLPRNDALKVMHPALSREQEYVVRFEREADVAAGLSHPSIVAVYDRGMDDGQLWLSMQYVEGTDAAEELRARGAMGLSRARTIVVQLADALDYAHGQGLVHRDVKPENALLAGAHTGERVMLADFGIAAALNHSHLTTTGKFVATASYAPLEQLEGNAVDARTDVYAFGAMLYELLTAQRPFAGYSVERLYAAKVQGETPDLSVRRPDLPIPVGGVIRRAMAREPESRYRTCGELAEALDQAMGHAPSLPLPAPRSDAPATTDAPVPSALPIPAGAPAPNAVLTAPVASATHGAFPPAPTFPPGSMFPVPPQPPTRTGPGAPGFPPGAPPGLPPTFPPAPPSGRGRRRRLLIIGAIAAVVVLVAGGLTTFLLLTRGPGTPGGLRADAGSGSVTLHWTKVSGAVRYQLFRSGIQLGDSTGTSYTDRNVQGGTTYQYGVAAVDNGGKRSGTATFRDVTPRVAAPAVATPTVDNLSVTLTWSAVPGATFYEVNRGGQTVATNLTATTYTDQVSAAGTAAYQVIAVDGTGRGGRSTTNVSVDVAPWGTMQPIASALPNLFPVAPDQTLTGPVAAHSCALTQPDAQNGAVEQVNCQFGDDIRVIVDRFNDSGAVSTDLNNYTSTISTWTNCAGQTAGQYAESTLSNGDPVELITLSAPAFPAPELANYDVYVEWTADQTMDTLRATFLQTNVLCQS